MRQRSFHLPPSSRDLRQTAFHEAGHFVAARHFALKGERSGIGFPTRVRVRLPSSKPDPSFGDPDGLTQVTMTRMSAAVVVLLAGPVAALIRAGLDQGLSGAETGAMVQHCWHGDLGILETYMSNDFDRACAAAYDRFPVRPHSGLRFVHRAWVLAGQIVGARWLEVTRLVEHLMRVGEVDGAALALLRAA